MQALIQCKSLTKRFGKFSAVDQVTFEVGNGEVFGLLGPNGAGKTTTMRLLSTLLKPTSGTATIAGYDLLREPQKVRASIGVLPEDAGLYDRLTPKEHLLYYGRLHGMPRDSLSKRADELLDTMELKDRANTKVGDFSKGMKQKVALLRAFIHDPPVLLLDEPTALASQMTSNFERSMIGLFSYMKRELEELVEFCKETKQGGGVLAKNHFIRHRLAQLAIDIDVGRAFAHFIVWSQIKGGLVVAAPLAAAAKVLATELKQRLGYTGCQVMGLYGQVEESQWAPLQGKFEKEYQQCVGLNMAGGTSEIMRNLVASLGLGLPRSW